MYLPLLHSVSLEKTSHCQKSRHISQHLGELMLELNCSGAKRCATRCEVMTHFFSVIMAIVPCVSYNSVGLYIFGRLKLKQSSLYEDQTEL